MTNHNRAINCHKRPSMRIFDKVVVSTTELMKRDFNPDC